MLFKIPSAILSVTLFFAPINLLNAQETAGKGCSALTEIDDSGKIIWSTSAEVSALIADVKILDIPAPEFHSLCNDNLPAEQATLESSEAETGQADASSTTKSTTAPASSAASGGLLSSSVIAPLGAGLGLSAVGGGGGGGGSSSSSSTSYFLDESTSSTYDAALDATWTARQEYKNSIYGAGTFTGNASTINPYTLVGINNAYARGLSGTGKVIAVYDTDYHSGTHLEFADKASASKISNDGTLTVGSDGTSWHGIHVAGTIAADYNSNNSSFLGSSFSDARDYGMMGVAYNASLHLSDFADTTVYSNSQDRVTAAIQAAETKNAIAQNNSWGWGTCQTGSGCTTIADLVTYQNNNSTSDSASMAGVLGGSATKWADMISAYESYQTTGVVVFANGNDYNSNDASLQPGLPVIATELVDSWLTVGNLNITGNTISAATMARIGNACGAAAEFCIFADGTDIWSSTGDTSSSTNNEYSTYTGSSMAAPIVSGAIALLSEAFPNHTPAQLQDRILASANNDFFTATGTTSFINGITHGYNSEFGHGLLDLATALGPISTSSIILPSNGNGALNIRYGDISSARRHTLTSTNVRLGAAFGDSINTALSGRTAYFYDALNGGFAFDMGALVKRRPTAKTSAHSFENVMRGNTISNHSASNGASFMSDITGGDLEDGSLMAFIPISEDSSSFIGNNIHIQNSMNFTRRSGSALNGVNSDSPFNISFLQASEQGTSVGNKLSVGDGSISLGLFSGKSKDYGIVTSGFLSEYGREIGNSHASFFIGITNENDGFLETSVEGAFAEESKATTTFTGISGYGWLNNIWSYNALGSVGSTQMSIDGVGLLSDIENITSSSFAFEAARPLGLSEKDSFHIGLSQPLRVEKGNAKILIPKLYEANGNLLFNNVEADLSPSGRQLDLNFGYQASLNNLFNIGIQMAISKDHGHLKSDEIIHSAVGFMKFEF